MLAIASLLDLEQNPESKLLWELLETRCKSFGIDSIPIPHFSWQVASDYDLTQLVPAISALVSTWKEFSVKTAGLGLFTGEIPALYLPIIKTRDLLEKHQELWELCMVFGNQISNLYSPENWLPHITLVHQGFSLEKATCVIEDLYTRKLDILFNVNKVEIIYQTDNEEGIKAEFSLLKG